MNWYCYVIEWKGRAQPVLRQMPERLAQELGGILVSDAEVRERSEPLVVAAIKALGAEGREPLVMASTPDTPLERGHPMTAEAPAGRL